MQKIFLMICLLFVTCSEALPNNFVYLKDIDPTIIQEMRYASYHNFVGRPIAGYESKTCILTRPTALALKNVQTYLRKKNLSLKVYDCYRPIVAVNDFLNWSRDPLDQTMKTEFYPRVDKKKFFKLGYVAEHSGHSRGSTVDATIVDLAQLEQENYQPNKPLKNCFAPYGKRFQDNSIDMGSGYDCMDTVAHFANKNISKQAQTNRIFFRKLMKENGFVPYKYEWWHFTLKKEPYKNRYFNFPIH